MKFAGVWYITEMELWDSAYYNMEVRAYIELKADGLGYLHFGLVQGQIDGEVEQVGRQQRFLFSFDGVDEMDPVTGVGWLQFKDKDTLTGKFKFHLGDSSTFTARRAR